MDNKCVYWRVVDSDEMPLKDLLEQSDLEFSKESRIHVYIKNNERVYAKHVYMVDYDIRTDQISFSGLFGCFTGPVFETIMNFGTMMNEFAESHGAKCHFMKYYFAVSKNAVDCSTDERQFIVHEHSTYTSAIDKYWVFKTETAAVRFFRDLLEGYGVKKDDIPSHHTEHIEGEDYITIAPLSDDDPMFGRRP